MQAFFDGHSPFQYLLVLPHVALRCRGVLRPLIRRVHVPSAAVGGAGAEEGGGAAAKVEGGNTLGRLEILWCSTLGDPSDTGESHSAQGGLKLVSLPTRRQRPFLVRPLPPTLPPESPCTPLPLTSHSYSTSSGRSLLHITCPSSSFSSFYGCHPAFLVPPPACHHLSPTPSPPPKLCKLSVVHCRVHNNSSSPPGPRGRSMLGPLGSESTQKSVGPPELRGRMAIVINESLTGPSSLPPFLLSNIPPFFLSSPSFIPPVLPSSLLPVLPSPHPPFFPPSLLPLLTCSRFLPPSSPPSPPQVHCRVHNNSDRPLGPLRIVIARDEPVTTTTPRAIVVSGPWTMLPAPHHPLPPPPPFLVPRLMHARISMPPDLTLMLSCATVLLKPPPCQSMVALASGVHKISGVGVVDARNSKPYDALTPTKVLDHSNFHVPWHGIMPHASHHMPLICLS
ncbi:unnamed protein product [Closterium sp. Naga37s-1]|nr:unnamed protein product [Closterium sp. Naga37s-1]